jgi:hypothetical protein
MADGTAAKCNVQAKTSTGKIGGKAGFSRGRVHVEVDAAVYD